MKSIHPTKINANIHLIRGDITSATVDAIVNAANRFLIPGGGVDHAIHVAAGPQLAKAVRKYLQCEPGCAVITPAFDLKANYVIHAVGPIWENRENKVELKETLAKTYASIFELAHRHHLASIAIPNISTGVYAFPKDVAARIALETTIEWLTTSQSKLVIYFYCFDEENYQLYKEILITSSISFNY